MKEYLLFLIGVLVSSGMMTLTSCGTYKQDPVDKYNHFLEKRIVK